MKFKTWLEFADYLLKNEIDIADVEINVPELKDPVEEKLEESLAELSDKIENSLNENTLVESVKILSLGDEPTIKHEIADVEVNELHVSSFDVIKEACGAGNIQLNESTIYLSICDMQGHTTTNMSISINEQRFSSMPLSLVESEEEKIVLSSNWLEENLK